MVSACSVIVMMESVSDESKPKKILGRETKISMGRITKIKMIHAATFTRNGRVSLTAATAAPLRPAAIAARMML